MESLLIAIATQVVSSGLLTTVLLQLWKRLHDAFDAKPAWVKLLAGSVLAGTVVWLNQKYGFSIPTDGTLTPEVVTGPLALAASVLIHQLWKAVKGKAKIEAAAPIGLALLFLLSGCAVEKHAPKAKQPKAEQVPNAHALDSIVAPTEVEPGGGATVDTTHPTVYRSASYAIYRQATTMSVPVMVYGVPLPAGSYFQVRYTFGKPAADSGFTVRVKRLYPAPGADGKVMVADTVPVTLPSLGDSIQVKAWVRFTVGTISSSWLASPARWYKNGVVPKPDSVRLGSPVALVLYPKTATLTYGAVQQFCCYGLFEDGAASYCDGSAGKALCDAHYQTFPVKRAWIHVTPAPYDLQRGRMVLASVQ